MSDDETAVFIGSLIVSLVCWGVWYVSPTRVRRVGARRSGLLLQVTPLVAAGVLFGVLRQAASFDVRDDPRYLAFYMLLGAAWVGFWIRLLSVTGISRRDDVVERGNGSAAMAIAGAMLGLTLCYAGGNIGDGPGWWVVVFSAGLASVALFAAWMLLEMTTGVSETVTVDRDAAAGLRLAGFLVACGLILGRGVAGDWESADATVNEFALAAWPVIVLVVAAAIVERVARPTPTNARPALLPYGVVPAALYIAAALYQLQRLGAVV
jgi:uncharacterized membrane protein YjfL (UPF0719 family)